MEKHYSALRVVARPDEFDRCTRRLRALSGVEVHHTDPPTGRIVVVHESDSLERQRERLLQIQRLPEVLLADLVLHYVDTQSRDADVPAGRKGATPS